jgi:hypothetical protein
MSQSITHPMDLALRLVWAGSILAHLILAVRIWQTGLARVYRVFFCYLGFRVVRSLVLECLPYQRDAYGYFWIATNPVLWFFYILIVLEVYSLVLQKYRGIAKLGRWAVVGGLVVSLVISALTLGTDLFNGSKQYPLLLYSNIVERGVVTSLVLFILFITAFLVWYPVPLARNTVVHCIVYAAYFLSMTMALLVRSLTGIQLVGSLNLAISSTTLACLLVWIFFLNQKGETATISVRQQWASEDESLIMEKLAHINSTLLRIARK